MQFSKADQMPYYTAGTIVTTRNQAIVECKLLLIAIKSTNTRAQVKIMNMKLDRLMKQYCIDRKELYEEKENEN